MKISTKLRSESTLQTEISTETKDLIWLFFKENKNNSIGEIARIFNLSNYKINKIIDEYLFSSRK